MKLTVRQILSIPHREALGFDDVRRFAITGVSTDSRQVAVGDLFVALRGDKFDGHNFLSAAIQKGAAAIMVDVRWAEANRQMLTSIHVPRLVVDETTRGMGHLALIHRRLFDIPVIAIAGSNGKTTTKEMIRSVLAQRFRVLATDGNHNNHIGVPQTLFRLEKRHDIAVIEVGTNHPGEIAYLCEIAEPTHGLITNIGQEHLEFFGSIEGVAAAEGELFTWLADHAGTGFINADDKHVIAIARRITKRVTYGVKSRSAKVKGSGLVVDGSGCAALAIRAGAKKFSVRVPVPGAHNAFNALSASAVGLAFGVPPGKINAALSTFEAVDKRMQVIRSNGVTIFNDAYNANPDSMLAALEALAACVARGKRIAVLGDMRELGAASEPAHAGIGKALRGLHIDAVLAFGPFSAHIIKAATIPVALHFERKDQLIQQVRSMVGAGDVVLVKGSRSMQMEDVVAALTTSSSQAA